ncbi:DUF6493 family protein [Streptomyces sp. NBC_00820]|uniref:DUF7825 domain-containing protein n=1 Tax=Streptomyces sp. NBC_00820 TaxID=2975842 RepID=UPI002ED301AF|nr:DUF6493 family protein [Streptomyces sp. NBC_00820]
MSATSALMDAVQDGNTTGTLRLVTKMTPAERRSCVTGLQALRKELRATSPWSDRSRQVGPALQLAGAACHTGAASAATWLAAADLRWRQAPAELLLEALADRDTGWLADVVLRLALRPVSARVPYALMADLVSRSGCEVPATDAYLIGWVRHISGGWGQGDGVLERLRGEPRLAALVGGLFTLTDLSEVRWPLTDGGAWPNALATLARERVLDRAFLADACVARLLRTRSSGQPTDHRVFLPLLVALGLTREEERARVADWTALARDAVVPVASHAQKALAGLALDGDSDRDGDGGGDGPGEAALTVRQLAEASEGLLFRAETKLVRAQLILLGKVLARDPGTAVDLLPAVAVAFGHEDTQVQERALKLLERHAKVIAPEEVRAGLARAAEQLTPVLRPRAARALGIAVPDAEIEVCDEVLPPAPEPFRLAPAPRTAEELAEEVGALLASEGDVAAFERALDGLVRHAYRDPDALREALAPVVTDRWWTTRDYPNWPRRDALFRDSVGLVVPHQGLDLVLAVLHGKVDTATLLDAVRLGPLERECAHSGLARVFDARLRDLAYRLRTDPPPLLLATPTWSTGLLEPGDLVDRLAEYRRLGARVCATDFAQALLRVRRGDRAAAEEDARRASELGTAEGARLARRLRTADALPAARRRVKGVRVLMELAELPESREGFPREFRWLGQPLSVFIDRRRCHHFSHAIRAHWLAVLPEHRELVAARLLHDVADTAVDDERGAAVLALLAESGGEAGEAVHLCVAYGLGARHHEDRLAAVDALLVLAARGQLDPVRLGTDLGELMGRGAVKPQRLADSARTAAATGANATIWEMLRHSLTVPLAELAGARPEAAAVLARGLGELLAVAADCAERSGAAGRPGGAETSGASGASGASGTVPHLAETAARGGSSRLVAQARRLRDLLSGEVAA